MRLLKTKLLTKRNIQFAIVLVVVITSSYVLFFPVRHTKTTLVYNNKYLCSIGSNGNNKLQNSIVIVVLSSRKNFMQRNLIRQSYGSIKQLNNIHILAVVFMLGSLDAPFVEPVDSSKLYNESVQYRDIIMGDFVDTYKNLSRKSIMAYDWLVSYCHEADILVKTDDDVLVNIFKLTEELSTWTLAVTESFNFWCAIHWQEVFDRNENSYYYVSPDEYPNDKVPKHCAGVGYITPMIMVRRVAEGIRKYFPDKICPQEDVFMTGIVPEKIMFVDNEPIEYVDRMTEWIFYIMENYGKENDLKVIYLKNVIEQSRNMSVDCVEFRKRFETCLFYLIDHGPNFENVYLQLWHIIQTCH